jgi:hypothetical protein
MRNDRLWKSRFFRWWRKINSGSGQAAKKFRPDLAINRNHDWTSLELLLVNNTSMTIWVEEALLTLITLDTSWQTSIPTGKAKQEIRQNIRVHESLELSLAQSIYEAGGKPQGGYSCLVSVNVWCRAGDECFHKILDTFQVKMTGLKPRSLRRLRWYDRIRARYRQS